MTAKKNIKTLRSSEEKAKIVESLLVKITRDLKTIRRVLGQKGHIMGPRSKWRNNSLGKLIVENTYDHALAERLARLHSRIRTYVDEI